MTEEPYSNYRLTVRVSFKNKPGVFAKVASILAKEGANLGAVDIVRVTKDEMIRDITFDVKDEAHGRKVTAALEKYKEIDVVSVSDQIFLLHLKGKLEVTTKFPIKTRNQLSMAYTPGVARVCESIAEKPNKASTLTIKRNMVAVVTDGSAVLGLGDLGPLASMPVMEGKAMIFKEFAGVDAFPICLDTQDVDEIVKTVKNIAPVFGGINLEDISAPRCYEIEERLKEELDIPVMHDDQHGTAVVVLAALENALKIVVKKMDEIKVVVNGMGAAGVAVSKILLAAGVRHLKGCGREGIIVNVEGDTLKEARVDFLSCMNRDNPTGSLEEALKDADVFIGLSSGGVLNKKLVKSMNKDAIIFALANPEPELDPTLAPDLCRIFATGRSDFPNQINNALAFPGIFRGALDVRATEINEAMKLAAAEAIAKLILPGQLSEEYIVPSIFDPHVAKRVASAVSRSARATGVSRSKRKQIHEE